MWDSSGTRVDSSGRDENSWLNTSWRCTVCYQNQNKPVLVWSLSGCHVRFQFCECVSSTRPGPKFPLVTQCHHRTQPVQQLYHKHMPLTLHLKVSQHRPKCSLNRLHDQGCDIPKLKAHSLKSKTASVWCFVLPFSVSLRLAHPVKWRTYVQPHPIPPGIKLSLLAFITSHFSSVSQSIPSL